MHHGAGILAAGLGMMFVYFAAIIAFVVTWIISLIDVIKNDFQKDSDKTMWLLILLLIAPIGTILYQLIGKKQKLTVTAFNGKIRTSNNIKPAQKVPEPKTEPIKAAKCTQCGNEMKERTVMSGEKAGQKFMVCSKYPNCRFVSPLTPEQA